MVGAALQGGGAVAGGLRLHERDEAAVRSVRVLHHSDAELVDPAQLLHHRMQSLLRRHPPDAAKGAWCDLRGVIRSTLVRGSSSRKTHARRLVQRRRHPRFPRQQLHLRRVELSQLGRVRVGVPGDT